MSSIARVCVFCGANPGRRPSYLQAAARFGSALAESGLGLVYGGGSVGLMGAVADGALAKGGHVFGVLPDFLFAREVGHKGLTELRVVASMHERKAIMAERSDAFVALPGGFGTLDEVFEILTWAQLGLHQKPVALLNVEGFFDSLLAYLDHATDEGLIQRAHRDFLLVEPDPDRLLAKLHEPRPPITVLAGTLAPRQT